MTTDLDEVTVERQPTVANAYAPLGSSEQAQAVRSPKSNTVTRVLGDLECADWDRLSSARQ